VLQVLTCAILKYANQKGFCEDLDEGKFSIALMHALKHASEADISILRHIFLQRHISHGMSSEQKYLVLDIFKAAGSLDYTLCMLRNLGIAIEAELNRVESLHNVQNEQLRALFDMLKV
jgi:geranylgeranyl pyrophosphate synthase